MIRADATDTDQCFFLTFKGKEKFYSLPSEPGKFSEGTEKFSGRPEKFSTFNIFLNL